MSFDYDLFVIGGGSGGVRAARTSAQEGAKVALAENHATLTLRRLAEAESSSEKAVQHAVAKGRAVREHQGDLALRCERRL